LSVAADLAMLFQRDLERLAQEVTAFPGDALLWATLPGISNSAGHLVLHLEGNLREFVGRRLGRLDYTRDRAQEFAGTALPQAELLTRIADLLPTITAVVGGLEPAQLEAEYPQDFMGRPLTTAAMLIHLNGHLQWHLGQIDYLRRALSGSGAIALASL
jgi:hypothetical protein